tara:strand:+ start:369 stop:674 length:306 start_codon:yes stop_codon:yes gene_type:complete
MVTTNKMRFNRKYKQPLQQPNSKKDISKLTGIPLTILNESYKRGIGAYKTNPKSVRPNMTKESWAISRVYSFVMKQPGTWGKADKDLADKVKKLKIKGFTK